MDTTLQWEHGQIESSCIAAEELVKLGYTNTLNLKDGMPGWEQPGFGIQDK